MISMLCPARCISNGTLSVFRLSALRKVHALDHSAECDETLQRQRPPLRFNLRLPGGDHRHLDGVRAVRRRHSLYHHGISHIISHSEWIQIHIEIPLYLHRYVLPIWVQYIHFSRHELLYLIPMDILQNSNL